MAVYPFEYYDGFSRETATLGSTRWSASDAGTVWKYTRFGGSGYLPQLSVNRGVGTMFVQAASPFVSAHVLHLNSATDVGREMLVRFATTNADDMAIGFTLNYGEIVNSLTGSLNVLDFYRIHVYRDSMHLILYTERTGSQSIGSATIPALLPDTEYWLRYKYDSATDTHYGRLWQAGTAEPSTWTYSRASRTDLARYKAGVPGIYTLNQPSSVSYDFSAFYVTNPRIVERSLPVQDTFERLRDRGLGMADSKHLWLDAGALDPALLAQGNSGMVGGQNAVLGDAYTGRKAYSIGPVVANSDANLTARLNGTGATLRLGVRTDRLLLSDGDTSRQSGYFVEMTAGSSTVSLLRVATDGTVVSLGTATLPSPVVEGTAYRLRLQANNQDLKTKVWDAATAEPATWMVTATDTTYTTGRTMVSPLFATTGSRQYTLEDLSVTTIDLSQATTPQSTLVNVTDDTSARVSLIYTGDTNNNCFVSAIIRPDDETADWQPLSNPTFEDSGSSKRQVFTVEGLSPDTAYTVVFTVTDSDQVIGNSTWTASFRTTATSTLIPDPPVVALTAGLTTITGSYTVLRDTNGNASVKARRRIRGTSQWSGYIVATKSGSTYSFSFSGLQSNRDYEVEVAVSDFDGYSYRNTFVKEPPSSELQTTFTFVASIKTLGQALFVAPDVMTASPAETSVLITIPYQYDLNGDGTFEIQYRAAHEQLYTTLPPASVTMQRSQSVCYAVIPYLRPAMTYEVVAYPIDPDGLSAGSQTELRLTFNTLGTVPNPDQRGKHYIYRIYNVDGKFVGTWPDAPDPSFTWDENGGVNDLRITLPRRFSALDSDQTIDFQNRVDVWVLDGTSRGMGVNMIEDANGDLGGWVMTTDWVRLNSGGADDGPCLRFNSTASTVRRIQSEPIYLDRVVPVSLSAIARATGGKLRMDIAAYDKDDKLIDVVNENAETVGTDWQRIVVEWLPPANTKYLRVRVENDGKGTMWINRVTMLVREQLIYRGTIDAFTVAFGPDGEEVEVEVLGYPSYLSDDYIEFLQYIAVQPQGDINDGKQKLRRDPTDPANMLKEVINIARKQNPRCPLYYTDESIKPTGVIAEYTFRDRLLRDCFDKIRTFCPPNWHYYIEPDGCVWLRSSEAHATTHYLRLNVEVSEYKSQRTIRNLKNVVRFKGRQDEDGSEPDGFGSIRYLAQDPESIKKYGRRVVPIADAQVTTPDMAEIIAEGRLEEYNIVEESGTAVIPDEKAMKTHDGSLLGYNVESIKPGDMVYIIDPDTGPSKTRWDEFNWNEAVWDSESHRLLRNAVPVKSLTYGTSGVSIQLSHLPPTTRGDYARMLGIMRRAAAND